MLDVRGLSFAYGDGSTVVRDLDLHLWQGEIVALLGASGCGKSTVLRLVSGLLEPAEGSIQWSGGKPDIGFVFQEPSLMPWATVTQNVLLPLTLARSAVQQDLSEKLLADVGLAGLGSRYPGTLSGGQRMRVSIARAIAAEPSVLLMDEPFAALDELLRFKMNELVLALRAQRGWAGLFVTHSLYEAAYLADRILVMKDGGIVGQVLPALDRSLPPAVQRTSSAFLAAVQDTGALMAGDEA